MAARGRECKHIFPYDVTSDYTSDVAFMALVRECVAGTYVSTVMKTRPPLAKRVRGGHQLPQAGQSERDVFASLPGLKIHCRPFIGIARRPQSDSDDGVGCRVGFCRQSERDVLQHE